MKGMVAMAAMLIFTFVMNIVGWAVFTATDIFLGGYSFVHFIMLAEWFVVPMAASAVYRRVTDRDHMLDRSEKVMFMFVWFVISAVGSGLICKCIDMGRWFPGSTFTRFDYLSYAVAFVIGFVVYSAAYEVIGFFVDRSFASHGAARG